MGAKGSGSALMVSLSNHEDAGVGVPGLVLRQDQDEASDGAVAGCEQSDWLMGLSEARQMIAARDFLDHPIGSSVPANVERFHADRTASGVARPRPLFASSNHEAHFGEVGDQAVFIMSDREPGLHSAIYGGSDFQCLVGQ